MAKEIVVEKPDHTTDAGVYAVVANYFNESTKIVLANVDTCSAFAASDYASTNTR